MQIIFEFEMCLCVLVDLGLIRSENMEPAESTIPRSIPLSLCLRNTI